MKILVFNGSPKKEKSDTLRITRAFLAGMEEAAPQEVCVIHTVERRIDIAAAASPACATAAPASTTTT